MAMGLPILARLAVDGIVKAIFMKHELYVTQQYGQPKGKAFKEELAKKMTDQKDEKDIQQAKKDLLEEKQKAQEENEKIVFQKENDVRKAAVVTFR